MNFKNVMLLAVCCLMTTNQAFSQTTIGSDDFDGNDSFLSRVFDPDLSMNPLPGTFTSDDEDVFGIVDRTVNFEIPDDTLTDPNFTGLVPQSKTDSFFCCLDLNNPKNPDAMGTLTYEFDVAGASDLVFSIDIGARGDFEASDSYVISASIDGSTPEVLIALVANEDIDHTYLYEDGVTMQTLNDPMTVDGTIVDNQIANFSANISGTGNVLTITFECTGDGGAETIVFDNLLIQSGAKKFIPGDVNCDGDVNLLDVQPFIDAVLNSVFDPKADVNGDGSDNLLDVQPFIDLVLP